MKGLTFRQLQQIIEYIYTGNVTVEAKEYDSVVEALKFLEIPIDDQDKKHESVPNQEITCSVVNNSMTTHGAGCYSETGQDKSTGTKMNPAIKKLPFKSRVPKASIQPMPKLSPLSHKILPTQEKMLPRKERDLHTAIHPKPPHFQNSSPTKPTIKNMEKGNFACRFCSRKYLMRKPFELHQMRCFHNPQIAKK